MNKIQLVNIVIFTLIIITFGAYHRDQYGEPIPSLQYKQVYINPDSVDLLGNRIRFVELTFYVEDGDGDLGFDSLITTDAVIKENLYLSLFVKDKGEFKKYEHDSIKQEYRIPHLEPEGYNKTIKADIKIKIDDYKIPLTGHDLPMPYDTIMYECYIIDRQEHKSNIVRTPMIIFPPLKLNKYKI